VLRPSAAPSLAGYGADYGSIVMSGAEGSVSRSAEVEVTAEEDRGDSGEEEEVMEEVHDSDSTGPEVGVQQAIPAFAVEGDENVLQHQAPLNQSPVQPRARRGRKRPQSTAAVLCVQQRKEFEERRTRIQQNNVSERTREMYMNYMIRFIEWLYANDQYYALITDEFKTNMREEHDKFMNGSDEVTEPAMTDESLPTTTYIKSVMLQKQINPIHFEKFTPVMFLDWVTHKVQQNPELTFQTCSSYKSGLMHMLKNYGVTLSIEAVKTLSSDFRGLKRTLNLSQSCNQDAKVTTGKVPLSYDLYSVFAKVMLQKPEREYVWARTFLILAWNLMSRSRNVCTLLYNHMEFVGDALRFYVIHAKNDQAGEKEPGCNKHSSRVEAWDNLRHVPEV